MNECKGCIYDLTNENVICQIKNNTDKLNIVLDNCCICKRSMLDEFKDEFKDMYRSE